MRQRLRSSLTYANVMATLAVFLVLGGGSAVALSGSNTVFSDDIVDNQVKTADVANDTLSGGGLVAADLRANSVGSSETGSAEDEIKDGTVDAQDLNGAIPRTVLIDPPVVPAQSCVTGQNAIAGVTNIDHLLVTTPATFTPISRSPRWRVPTTTCGSASATPRVPRSTRVPKPFM